MHFWSETESGGEQGGSRPGLGEGDQQAGWPGVLLGALLGDCRGSRHRARVLRAGLALPALHFTSASSGAEIDIETESCVCEAGGGESLELFIGPNSINMSELQ